MSDSELVTKVGRLPRPREPVSDAMRSTVDGGFAATAESTDVTARTGSMSTASFPPRLFDWAALPRLSRTAVLCARAHRFNGPALAAAVAGVASDWTHDLGSPVTLSTMRVGAVRPDRVLADPGCHAVLELGAGGVPVCVSLDLPLASAMIDRLSGGEGRATDHVAPLGAVERGVISYLLLRALNRMVACAQLAGLAPRLTAILTRAPSFAAVYQGALSVTVEVEVGFAKGLVTLTAPAAALAGDAPPLRSPGSWPEAVARLPLTLVAEIGSARVRSSEIAVLAPGDVVVCDRVSTSVGGQSTEVLAVRLRVLGTPQGVHGRAEREPRGWRLVVGNTLCQERIVCEEESPMNEPTTGEALVADAAVTVTVELGRIAIRVDELSALQAGDTLLLGCVPGAPLDLVVGGQILARGELVDVEGELGLRILSVR